MSNKKRIQKKKIRIEKANINDFIFRMKGLNVASRKSADSLDGLAKILDDFYSGNGFLGQNIYIDYTKCLENKNDREVKVFQEHVYGYSFEIEKNTEYEDFLHDIRVLCNDPFDRMIEVYCKITPIELRQDVKGLLMAGFTLEEAFTELRETYKF